MKVKSTKRRKHRKHNPAKSRKSPSTHRRRRRSNPARATTHHRRRRRRRNPSSGIAGMGMDVLVVVGALGGSAYLNNFAAKWIPVKFRGAASLAVGAALAMFIKNDKAKIAGLVAAGAGAWDMLRQNVPALTALSAEDAGFLLGSAAADDPDLAEMLGASNSNVSGVIPNVFGGYSNGGIPGVVPNVFGVDTAEVPLGVDTAEVPLGDDEDGESLFGSQWRT